MNDKWVYPPTVPFQVQGRDLSEDNFAQEGRTSLEILIREALQNPLDVRAPDNLGPVIVKISVLQPGEFDAEYLASLLSGEYSSRLEASGGDPMPDLSSTSILILEDFGTTGLQGTWDNQDKDGLGENWNAFWFREGEGAKAVKGSNGRAGQGKITFYRISAARAVFGFTVRKSDNVRLLMGRSAFRRVYPYPTGGPKYLRHSFWCTGGDQPLPITDDNEIMAFRKAFGLTRRSDEPGLSLVIPAPTGFDASEAKRTIIANFYYPIANGNLEIQIGDTYISAANIDSLAVQILTDDVVRKIGSSFSKGFRAMVKSVIVDEIRGVEPVELKLGWDRTPSIPTDALPDNTIEQLRATLEKGERISIRCPVNVKPKKDEVVQSWFDVHIEVPEDLDRTEEAYIRCDLLIGEESHLATNSYLQKARGLILIKDVPLSAFLADAEEPTHLRWNGSRPRLAEDYSNPQATLRAVRNAAPRILALLSNGMVKRDMKALAKYFTRPAEEGKKHAAGGQKPGTKKPDEVEKIPAPIRKPFRLKTGSDSIQVLPNGSVSPKAEELPMSCTLEIAYEGLDLDPFKAYDPFDFDLSDARVHAINASGATVTERQGNRIRFDVMTPDFELEVPGFDPNIRLRARLNYTEKDNGTSVSEE